MAFVHPAIGAIAVLLTVWFGSRGLVARQGTKASPKARRTHRRYAWWALVAMGLAAVTGLASTVWLRDDLEIGDTWHLEIGLAVVALMGVGALLTRRFTKTTPALRTAHLVLGLLAVAGSVLQAIVGIELLP